MRLRSTLRIITLIAAIYTLSGCAFHTGFINDSTSLSSGNFQYVNHAAKGSAKATIVLFIGIGGLSKQSLVNSAKQDLLRNFHLKDNQALANITINFKKTLVYPIVYINNCTITADIVEFSSGNNSPNREISDSVGTLSQNYTSAIEQLKEAETKYNDLKKRLDDVNENKGDGNSQNQLKSYKDQIEALNAELASMTEKNKSLNNQLNIVNEKSSTQSVTPKPEAPKQVRASTNVIESKPVAKSNIESKNTYRIQFFKSKDSNKSFSKLSGIGKLISFQEGNITSYVLEVDDPSKLQKVRDAGFADAFIVDNH